MPHILNILKKLSLQTYNPAKLSLEICRFLIVFYLFFEFSIEISLDFNTRDKYPIIARFFIMIILLMEFLANPGIENEPDFLENQTPQAHNKRKITCKTMGFLSVFFYFILPKSVFAKILDLFLLFYYEECKKTLEFWSLAIRKTDFIEKLIDFGLILMKFLLLLHLLTSLALFSEFFNEDPAFLQLKESGLIIEVYFYSLTQTLRLFFMKSSENHEEGNSIQHFIFLFLWLCLFLTLLMDYSYKFFSFSRTSNLKKLNKYLKLNSMDFETEMRLKKYIQNFEKAGFKEDLTPSIDLINSLEKKLKKKIMKSSKIMLISNYSRLFLRFSKSTNRKLIKKLKYRLIKPGEYVFSQGDQNPSLILIISGVFDLEFNNKENNKPCVIFQTIEVLIFLYKI